MTENEEPEAVEEQSAEEPEAEETADDVLADGVEAEDGVVYKEGETPPPEAAGAARVGYDPAPVAMPDDGPFEEEAAEGTTEEEAQAEE